MKKVIQFVRKKNKSWSEQVVELVFIFIPIIFLVRTFIFGLYQVPTGSMETTLLVGERFFADKLTIWFKKPQRGEIISFNAPPADFNYSKNPMVKFLQNYLWVPGGATPANWTKRVIATPGDEIKGVIEDGHPVVYLKKAGEAEFQKLDEPYVNQYPLVHIYDKSGSGSRGYLRTESYDPECSYADQPFYRMTKEEVAMGSTYAKMAGRPPVLYPNTPAYSPEGRNLDIYHRKLGENEYWAMGDNRLGSHDSRAWGPVNYSYIHGKIVYRIFSMDSESDWMIVDLIKHPIEFWKRIRWERCLEFVK